MTDDYVDLNNLIQHRVKEAVESTKRDIYQYVADQMVDENISPEVIFRLTGVDVGMIRSNFIQNLEKELVESAVKEKVKSEIAVKMKNEGFSKDTIKKFTGIEF